MKSTLSLLSILVLSTGLSHASQTTSGNTRIFLLEGELLLYPAGISELPAEVQISVDAPRRSLAVRSFAHASLDGSGLQGLASDDLVADGARIALTAGDGALDLSNLVLISDGKHWTIHGGAGDLLGKPLFTAASADALRMVSNDQFQLHAELLLDPAFAQELGLAHAAGAIAGALTLQGSSHPGNVVSAGAPQVSGTASSNLVPGPDIIVSTVGSTSSTAIQKYGTVGSTTGYAVTTISCNIGTANAIWIDCTSGSNCNQHPVIGQNMYRLKTVAGSTRFEQIGMSWLKHGFCAADAQNATTCPGTYVPNSSCDWLGLFATDTYGSGLNGSQANLGPRSEINAWTGAFPYPYVLNWNLTGDAVYKRLQLPNADIDPAQNAGAQYWCEVQYVATDEPDGNKYNNVSYRSVALGAQGDTPPGSAILFNGSTVQQQPAINAWAVADPGVTITPIDVPGDGRLYLGHKVTNLGGGQYHYEYALYNMNCDGSVQAVSVPVGSSVTLSNTGFRDVPYHSGESYSGTDWGSVNASGALTWSTQTFAANANANALRWGSTYNYRFDANAAPVPGSITLTIFKNGSSVVVPANVPANAGGAINSVCWPGQSGVTACPCANAPLLPGYGCENSSSTGGANIFASGNASLSTDSLVFTTSGEKPTATSIVLQGDALSATGSAFGMGIRCVSGSLKRLYTKTAAAGSITAPQGADAAISARSAALGDAIPTGAHRYYGVYYRDPTVLGGCAATSTFNITQQLDVTWNP